MNHLSIDWFFGRKLADATALGATRRSSRRFRVGRLGRLLSAIARPFHRSIRVRLQFVFGLAVFGLVLMATITLVSGRILLNTYENSVSEARFELVPAHLLQVALREAEQLTYLYAINGERSAPSYFKKITETIDAQFQKLTEIDSRFGSLEHSHSNISIPETIQAWRNAQAAALEMFRHPPGTAEAVKALKRAHAAIDPVYDTISEFHHGSMQDLQERLRFAQSVAYRTYFTTFGAILIGFGVLIAMGLIVGRSVLHPIAELQGAARRLGRKDFSRRIRLRNTRDELGQLGRAFNIAFTALQQLFKELERRATHDGLTGALNRAAFDACLSMECMCADRHKQSLSLLMVDIDFFKCVNDDYGHQIGDLVLQTVARLLDDSIRPKDVVARYGGEEFVVILPDTDENEAMALANRLRVAIGKHSFSRPADEDFNITVSIGCASRLPNTMASEDLVKEADAALYRAKEAGRNRIASARALAPTSGAGWVTAAA